MRLAILLIGAVLGFFIGYQTRPSMLGVKMPLGIIGSQHPMDAPFKNEMIEHLTIATGIGIALALIAVLAVTALQRKS